MLKTLPAHERPREKLLARGSAALADAELLALLLRTGSRGVGVLELARQVLDRCHGFAGLLGAAAHTRGSAGSGAAGKGLAGIKGLGPAKRAELLAVMEIARRAIAQPLAAAPVFEAPAQVKDYLALHLGGLAREVFAVMFLDSQHRLAAFEHLFQGTVNQTSVHPREVVRRALELNAAAVVLAHNHPSGVAEPSRADEFVTQSLKAALQLVDVRVLDHLVVGRGQVVSFAERGLL
ncbi:MAG: DNA repair protein RadC [Rubrivivax sp.]|nr:DNA repair protein RadC [Rubrivivax sp.]